jgi:hypothetical protein
MAIITVNHEDFVATIKILKWIIENFFSENVKGKNASGKNTKPDFFKKTMTIKVCITCREQVSRWQKSNIFSK